MQARLILGVALALLSFCSRAEVQAADVVRVSDGPFLSGGGYYVAREKGYFQKLGIEIQHREFIDGSLSVPAFVSGELDIGGMTAAASLFNSVAKGAPLLIVLDRGHNRPGYGYTVTSVSQELYDQGVRALADFGKLKGKRVGVGALGSINQYNLALALAKARLNPAKDVQWTVNVAQPDLMKMLGQKQVDVTDLAYQFGFFAQNNKWGPMIATGDEVAPGTAIATFAVRKDYLQKNRDIVIRWSMAYLQGVKEFNAAAAAPDAHADVVAILARTTALNKPELIKAIAPHWSYVNEDGTPPVDSIMQMQDFWNGKDFHFVESKVPREQLFDLSVAKEAKARLDREKPFGN
ncbi:MAG: ABC transporter substrate-binding protein [Alphaproteobacteria bacterium]|nr:MAG: ABC transporter substrate-binding protein [Alphaproteobacteria bacterium]